MARLCENSSGYVTKIEEYFKQLGHRLFSSNAKTYTIYMYSKLQKPF